MKAVVDLEQEIMAVGGELHADEEVLLSKRKFQTGKHVGNKYLSKNQKMIGLNLIL